jgi:hypothetical protein
MDPRICYALMAKGQLCMQNGPLYPSAVEEFLTTSSLQFETAFYSRTSSGCLLQAIFTSSLQYDAKKFNCVTVISEAGIAQSV